MAAAPRLAVFGPTGGTGRQVITQALDRGYEVTALARSPERLPRLPGLRVVAGDVLDPHDVDQVVAGSDAVVSALGIGYSRAATTVYSAGTGTILGAMRRSGVRRVLVVSTSSLWAPPRRYVAEWLFTRLVLHPLLRRPYADIVRMERLLRESTADWTVVRPARLTNGRHTGRYRTALDGRLRGCWSISRADVAHCLLAHVDDARSHRAVLDVAY